MGVFDFLRGSNLDQIKNTRDMPALWRVYRKDPNKAWPIVSGLVDEFWEYAVEQWYADKKSNGFVLELLSDRLVKAGKPYAGAIREKPVELLSRFRRSYIGTKPPVLEDALCPVCKSYLSESPVTPAQGYSRCGECQRHYHRSCTFDLESCVVCGASRIEVEGANQSGKPFTNERVM